MSKINAIRKKALELVRKQDWPAAIKEYRRLAELDQSNPNVYNELGDLYLKTNAKNEAYDAFVQAIDAYTRVSLHNNAVAVCKKVLRLVPNRYEVLAKLGLIRLKQGLGKEAESYYASYLAKLAVETAVDPKEVVKHTAEIVDEMADSVSLHERASECLLQHNLKDDAGRVLVKLFKLHKQRGETASANAVCEKMDSLGLSEMIASVKDQPVKSGKVITEDNIWTESHSEGERISTAEDSTEAVYEYGNVDMKGASAANASSAASGAPAPNDSGAADTHTGVATEPPPAPPSVPPSHAPAQPVGPDTTDAAPAAPVAPEAPVTPDIAAPPETPGETATPVAPQPPAGAPAPEQPDTSAAGADSDAQSSDEVVHVSAIIDEAAHDAGPATEEDYRSHYDLGMAYLEMDLLSEAIREYQVAAKSPQFRVKSLEMIGLCFLKQNQPKLAIKQLVKGLELIGSDDREALGIRYNLGLAYEEIGDFENARSQYEDVYVVDVTFRDVAERVQKLSG